MNEDKLHAALSAGARADALLKNDLLNETFDYLAKEYIEHWKISPARDTDARERLWQAVNVIGKVKEHFIKVLNDGKLAQSDLNRLASKQG